MKGMDSNHYNIVGESLSGHRAVDEQTFTSLEILREKLERLKQIDSGFADIAFSSAVKNLVQQNSRLTEPVSM